MRQRIESGYFEMANNGTLLLDEIADLSLDIQVKLLRVVDNRTLRRLGSALKRSPFKNALSVHSTEIPDNLSNLDSSAAIYSIASTFFLFT